MLAHNVYFTLNETSESAQQALIDGCKKHLTDHPGTVFFGVGQVATGLERPVNDRDFHIALQIVFQDRAAHDAYQAAERHDQFIAEFKENWKQVRVFDVDLSSD